MDSASIISAMSGQSATNGWDAICALDAQLVNSIFFQQYLQDGPTNPATPLQVILQGEDTSFWILDLVAGPPGVTFPGDLNLQQVQVTMFLVRGALIEFDPNQLVIKNAILVEPNESWVTGALNFGQVTGQGTTLGQIFVDLGSGAYQPLVKGVDPDSVLAREIGTALQTFFADNATRYPLGILMETGVPACLQPTKFDFVTQPAPGSTTGDGCVLLLIQTNGSGGAVGQLDPYPIPSEEAVALIVSNQVIFNQLLPWALTAEFKPLGTNFTGQSVNGVWQTSGNGGSINAGRVDGDSDLTAYWTQDERYGSETPVVVPISTFTISSQPTGLNASWQYSWTQGWGYLPAGHSAYPDWDTIRMSLSCQFTAPAAVDQTTDIVSFGGRPATNVSYQKSSILDDIFGNGSEADAAGDIISKAVGAALNQLFSAFQLPAINTFALGNLLFPNRHAIALQNVSLPCDLLLTGQMQQPLTVSPPTVDLEPGQTQQFTAMSAGQPVTTVLWELKPTLGSITSSGLYTAPGSVARAEVVVVTAISQSDASLVGSAMVLVYRPVPATGLVVSPANLILTPGQSFELFVTDDNGSPVAATCTLSPSLGQITQGLGTGQWTYTAPSSITEATSVTATATGIADPSQTGTGTVNLTPTEEIQITPASATVEVGHSLQLQATSADLTDYSWQIFPYGVGGITPDESDDSQATYTAPASVASSNTEVAVVAYSLGDSVGIGLARITVVSPN
jgi:hypothetical protein